jgi:PAS domain S-box-containing protein
VATTGAFLVAAWWAYGYRRGSFPAIGFVLEPALLIIAAGLLPLPMRGLGLFYAGLQLRALYVSRRELPLLILGYEIGRIASVFIVGLDDFFGPPALTLQLVALAVIAVTLHLFVSALNRQARVEQELKRSDERYRLLAAATRDVFYDLDIVTGAIEWSESMQSVFGHPAADAERSRNWFTECVHPDDRDGFQEAIDNFFANPDGALDTHRYRFRRGDGSYAYVVSNALMKRGPDGAPSRVMGAVRDITVEHQLAEQLRQSQKMEAVGQLAGGVAHDFNNLLTVIGGHVYMLEQKLEHSAATEKHLRGITVTAERAAALTKQLLAFSRKQLLKPTVLNANVVVDDVIQMIRPVIGEHVQITTELDPLLLPVLADAGQLSQVLVNLALNSRDAMPRGGTLTIATRNAHLASGDEEAVTASLQPGDYVRIVVRDTGIGMDKATLARAFEPFFTTKPPGSGTGLGLATVYGIVKQSLGDIRAVSTPGEGATLTVLLPAARRSAEMRPSRAHLATDEVDSVSGRHVLLVEDDDGVREFAREVLSSVGYVVHEARNGADGLDMARRGLTNLDLVVTDVVMPRMGGREMVDHLRRERPDLRVLYMTGYTDDSRMLGELRGTDARLLEKPFSARALTNAVADVALRDNG